MTSTLTSIPGLILLCLLGGIPSASLVEQDPQAGDLMESSNFQFSASAAAILPNGFGLTTPPSKPSLSETDMNPRFHLRAMTQNITAIEGREVRLECAVYNLGNKTVSWLRDENLNIISSGRYTYTSDQRFQALHEEDFSPSDRDETLEHWILQIRNAQMEDEGRYECQISTQPITSYHFYLKVVVPATPIRVLGSVPLATILGKPEMFVDVGSTINITCIVQHTPGPPSIVQWQHNGHPIDYTSTRGGVSVLTNKAATTVSSLIIQQARTEDGGTYTCRAGDLVTPSNVKVHVIHGDNYQSLHTNSAHRSWPSTPVIWIFFSLALGHIMVRAGLASAFLLHLLCYMILKKLADRDVQVSPSSHVIDGTRMKDHPSI